MGKNKVAEAKGGSDVADDEDLRTVFVRNLPFSLTDSQLEDVFSEVGPVRHSFTVQEKGSDQHRGFGFVQFAVTEDVHRAIQEKNGALLQGRKIRVEIAKRRAPLDVRYSKSESLKPESTNLDPGELPKSDTSRSNSKKRKSDGSQSLNSVGKAKGDFTESTKKLKAASPAPLANVELRREEAGKKTNGEHTEGKRKKSAAEPHMEVKADQKKEYDEEQGSSKQRPARTVVVGGLASAEMLDSVLIEANKVGQVEAIQKAFTELELSSRGLAKDGCKPPAAAIVFLSVKAACKAVAALHNRTFSGGVVWARQLGGEGSKLKQLRLIVRNLPFQVTEATLRKLFSSAGFVWEVTIPRKPDGLSKGFAFIGFTSKVDAEKAVHTVNGKLVGNRTVAVDWAVAKKQYEAAVDPVTSLNAADVDLEESKSTASESKSDDDNDSRSDEDDSKLLRESVLLAKQPKAANKKMEQKKQAQEELILEKDEDELDVQLKEPDHFAEDKKSGHAEKMNRTEEIDMVKKILTKVVTSMQNQEPSDDEEIAEALGNEHPVHKQLKTFIAKEQTSKALTSNQNRPVPLTKVEVAEQVNENDGKESKLSRTVFIRNLPREAKVPELRKLFSEFGEIKSLRLVLNQITRKSKGNAFLEYARQEAAQSAVAAAANSGADNLGLMLKGRAVSVTMAVDKDSARKLAKEAFHRQVEGDKRNLALSKEGQILVGTSAAEGVSRKGMLKRQQLEHEKATKLRSPNFHVSKIRLSVHNIPKAMTERELKKLFIEAVKARASKQSPVIKQVKILRDGDSQKSRGAAFVEFTEHQHALVALRVLNNNPDVFGTENRPIVEFAIENSLILQKRAANAAQAKNWQSKGGAQPKRMHGLDDVDEKQRNNSKTKRHKITQGEEIRTGKIENENYLETGRPQVEREKSHPKAASKIKDGKGRVQDNRTANGTKSQARAIGKDHPNDGLQDGEKPELKSEQKVKGDRTWAHRKEVKSKNFGHLQSVGLNGRNQMESKKRKNPSRGGDTEDRLDKLVAEYRTKYFSNMTKPAVSKGISIGSGDLRRWFE